MKDLKKLAVILLVVFLIANLALFALKIITVFLFWIIIIVIGAIAYKDAIKRFLKP